MSRRFLPGVWLSAEEEGTALFRRHADEQRFHRFQAAQSQLMRRPHRGLRLPREGERGARGGVLVPMRRERLTSE